MSRQPGRTSRREARERAIELSYEAHVRSLTIDQLLETLVLDPEPLAIRLMRMAEKEAERAEALIAAKAKGWTIERMPLIDRLVMRQAVAELLTSDTPVGVVLSEAVELVGRYSTDESSRFVNGVLAAIAREVRD